MDMGDQGIQFHTNSPSSFQVLSVRGVRWSDEEKNFSIRKLRGDKVSGSLIGFLIG